MAKAIGMYTERFFESQRLTMTIEAFDNVGKTAHKKGFGKWEDRVDFSPLANLGSSLDRFRRIAKDGSRAEVSLTTSDGGISGGSLDPKLERDLDFIMRLMAHDEADLNRLRKQFKDLFALARGGSQAGNPATNVEAQQASQAGQAGQAGQASQASQTNRAVPASSESGPTIELTTQSEVERRQEVRVSLVKGKAGLVVKGVKISQADPLVLDLEGNGFDLTSVGEGGRFDINADGATDVTGWVKGKDALLVMDRNGNGRIDDGRELFGDQNGAANGFLELAKFDLNKDNKITKSDTVFKALKLYRDLNGDGTIQQGELASLSQMGITSLNLRFVRESGKVNGNALLLKATFQREDGSEGKIGDFAFGYKSGKVDK